MSTSPRLAPDGAASAALHAAIVQLARTASVEINVADVPHLDAARALLPAGTRIYVSHLPKQKWQDTEATCRAVQAAGFKPVPHIPVRLLPDAQTLEALLSGLIANARVQEVLLIAGDYPQPLGPFATVSDVLRTGVLQRHGIRGVSLAGHPEGHPKVELAEIRRAEREKVALAVEAGLEPRMVTQFFFDAAPFVEWTRDLRAHDIDVPMVAGLAGPAKLATLVRFAMRCGVGPSIRALSARGASILKIMDSHGPEDVLRELAKSGLSGADEVSGVHFFCFGGFLRTCEWVHTVAAGRFTLNDAGGFDVAI